MMDQLARDWIKEGQNMTREEGKRRVIWLAIDQTCLETIVIQ